MESSPPSPYTEPDGLFTPPAAEESPIDRFASPSDKLAHDSRAPPSPHNHDTAPGRLPSDDPSDGDMSHPREAISKLLNGKEHEWNSIAQKKAPLQLLDLPVDILRGIIDNLPHTNDLTSLALCHSALHALTIPCIYSRFDIVWPDNAAHTEPRSGVDALTYGLATLVMGEEIFGESPAQRAYREQTSARYNRPKPSHDDPFPLPKRRRGNHFAHYTKKFSLGNGPPEWVQEYLITKEGGKMLGTLVAIAVARMRNLETFVWDMPTGVLRDVWLALSSLAERDDGEDCRLERLWIRWHDNYQADVTGPVVPPPLPINNLPPPPPHHAHHVSGAGVAQAPIVVPAVQPAPLLMSAMDRVEHPTFSVIPALKSLSVLDIDELPYLDEMAILIGRSQRKLRELRIGVARHVHDHERDWVNVWEGDGVQQVDHSTTWTAASKIGEKRLGGVLGILVGRVYNMRRNSESEEKLGAVDRALTAGTLSAKSNLNLPEETVLDREQDTNNPFAIPITHGGMYGSQTTGAAAQALDESGHSSYSTAPSSVASSPVHGRKRQGGGASKLDRQRREQEKSLGPVLNTKLRLETLELERVPLSVPVLLRAFDWTVLSTLTLLNCHNHEQLWKSLRRQYTPRPTPSCYASGSPSKSPRSSMNTRYEYSLNLKKIHTNTVSSSLISFLKETLAPNSLEVLFLQEDRSYHSSVSVESIFRGPLRRHRASLKKVMIDSSERGADGHPSTRWRRWMLTRDIITFITSGRMPQLRELAVTIDYHDWHYFLQRLPQIPHVRSLYIPHVADHAHGNNIDPRELALQIVDIIALRPELEICYMGISTKCFEVLENKHASTSESSSMTLDGSGGSAFGGHVGGGGEGLGFTDDEEDDVDDEDVEEDEGEETEEGGSDEEEEPDDAFDGDESDDESFVHSEDGRGSGTRLRLREILFYDDKVAIFKARHGRL